jgi:hypothetical protein
MRNSVLLLSVAALAACGQSSDSADNAAAAKSAAAQKPRPAYCFFKPEETKGWKVSRGRDGNVVVKGTVYREDSRYQAVLAPPKISGTTAEVSPTIQQNETSFGAPDNWWPITTPIPDSAAVTNVKVTCGEDIIAQLAVPARK